MTKLVHTSVPATVCPHNNKTEQCLEQYSFQLPVDIWPELSQWSKNDKPRNVCRDCHHIVYGHVENPEYIVYNTSGLG